MQTQNEQNEKKNATDVGLTYLQLLKMNPPTQSDGLYHQFRMKYGDVTGRGILSDLYRIIEQSESNPEYLKEFYALKNDNLDKALLFNGGYSADTYRNVCNWISDNAAVFGEKILDAGCECGIMSCFLAIAFPNSHITAVDRCQNAILRGEELAERIGVKNITFRCADISEIPAEEKFDTVFSMRMLQENCDLTGIMEDYRMLLEEASLFREKIRSYSEQLSGLTAEGGHIVSVERCDVDPVLLGWMKALNDRGFGILTQTYKELVCAEMEHRGCEQAFIAQKGASEEEEEVYRFWCLCQTMHTELVASSQYFGWYADMMLQNIHGEYLGGFLLENPEGRSILIYSLWENKDNKDRVLLYQAMGDDHTLTFYAASRKEELLAQLKDLEKEYTAQGMRVR